MELNKHLIILFFGLILATSVMAGTNLTVEVTTASNGEVIYSTANGNNTVEFNVQDIDTDNLTANIYYSSTDTGKDNLINSTPLDLTAGTCVDSDFSDVTSCTYNIIDVSSIPDGKYYFVVEVSEVDGDKSVSDGSENKIIFDNSIPIINFVSPSGEYTNSQTIKFDVNEGNYPNDSNIDVSTISVEFLVDGNPETNNFKPATNCQLNNGSYSCSYDHDMVNGTKYNININANDNAKNLASQVTKTFTYDTDPPSAPDDLLAVKGAGQVELSWTASTDNFDLNGYEVYYAEGDFTDVADATYAGLASTNSYTVTGLTSGTIYFFKVRAVDVANNFSNLSDYNVATPDPASVSTPVISSSSHAEDSWVSNNDVSFSWTVVSGQTYYCAFDSSSNTEPTAECSGGSINYNDKSDGEYYFHLRTKSGSTYSETDHYKVKIDATIPPVPNNVSATAQDDGSIKIEWTQSSDALSGTSGYYVYRGTTSGFDATTSIGDTTGTSYTDSSVSDNTKYYYVVKAKDNAGNYSNKSDEVSATTGTIESFSLILDSPAYANAGSISIVVSSTGCDMNNGIIKIRKSGGDYVTIESGFDGSSKTSSYSFDSGDDGTWEIYAATNNCSGVLVEKTRSVIVDTVNPTVEWDSPNNGVTITSDIELNAKATDSGSGIKKVMFYFGTTNLGSDTTANADDIYSINLSLNDVSSGTGELKAVVEDLAGNLKTSIIDVTIQKTSDVEASAEEMITQTETRQNSVYNFIDELKSSGISLPEEFSLLLEKADANLAQAKALFDDGDLVQAKEMAASAKIAFIELISNYSIEQFGETQEYVFDMNLLEETLKKIFANQNTINEAKKMLEEHSVTRKLIISKITFYEKEYYKVGIVLYITNNSSSGQTFKIIEIIPKSFAQTFDDLDSAFDFVLIKNDPVVGFVANLGAGETQEIAYSLKEELTEEQATALLEENPLNKFEILPILVSATTNIDETHFIDAFGFTPGQLDLSVILLMVFIIFIVLSIGLYFAFIHEKSDEPFPKKNKWAIDEQKPRSIQRINEPTETKTRWEYKYRRKP